MPAYNEASRVGAAVVGVKPYVDTVIVVDDGSSDGTAEAAKAAGAFVIRHAVNRGQGAALATGNAAAIALGAKIFVHVDADGQMAPENIPALVGPLKAGEADVVFGSRFLGVDAEGMPLIRRGVLWLGRVFSLYVLGISRRMTDPQTGLRALTSEAVACLPFRQDGKAHCSEILRLVSRSSLRWKEIPALIRYNADTLAKGNRTSDAFRIVWQLFLGAFQR